MKKLILLAAFIISVNSFAGISLTGGTSGSWSTITNASGGKDLSGNFAFTNSGTSKITLTTGTDKILSGTVIQLPVGGKLEIYKIDGTGTPQLIKAVQGNSTSVSYYTFTSNLDGNANTLPAGTAPEVAALTPGGTPTPTPSPTPTPTPSPSPAPTPTPTPGTQTKNYMPRSRVDYDLTKAMTTSGFAGLENARNDKNGTSLDIKYIGETGRYKDGGDKVVKYRKTTNGMALVGTVGVDNFIFGGGFGYQDSSIKYREKFYGIKENLDSYQFMISGGYNFTKDTDLSSVLTYSHNKHKYNSSSLKYTAYDDAKYNSKVIDFQMRLGSKFSSNESYIKPFIGFGITNVTENEIEKLGLDKAKGTSANTTIGAYGQLALSSSVNLFGNLEYEHRFSNKSYHRDRNFKNISGKMEALDYDGIFNAEVGVKFKLSRFDVTTSYELRDIHNHLFKVGFGVKF